MSLLKLEDVSYAYKGMDQNVLNGLNCTFEKGKLYAIMGPSGSGKSTLLSIISGLDLPTQGTVFYGDEDISKLNLDNYRKCHLSMIFQAFHLLPLLTVHENVCYPMEINGVTTKEAKIVSEKILKNLGIQSNQLKRFPSHLSGGEQQRIAIARSIASGAKVLLADEPTGNLDSKNTINIIKILKNLAHQKDYCIIIVTHDQEVADEADINYMMKEGKLI